MNAFKVFLYGTLLVIYFVILHIFLHPIFQSGVKNAIDDFLADPLTYWWGIFELIGLAIILGLIIYYGIIFLASFGKGYTNKSLYSTGISILIASKNEKKLLERTLNSIIESDYPKEKIQVIVVTSGSTDDTDEFCQNFKKMHQDLDIEILNEVISKKGKPPALNYGLKSVKNDIVVLYDSGCILEQKTLINLVSPFQHEKINATIGPVLVKNWNKNKLTKGILLDYTIISGGGITFEMKNRIGSSAYAYGRNFAVRTQYLKKYGGFNEDSMTEDLYLSVLLNLDGINIYFSPKAKVYEYVPTTWGILIQQRTRWMAGYISDMPQLMAMKKEKKSGKSIIISRNLTMTLIGNLDTWIPLVIGFSILYILIGEYYLLTWNISCLIFQFGFLFNGVRKYGDKHYSILLFFLISGYIHLYMFLRQFRLPRELSWEKTPMLLEKQEEEINALSSK